MRLSQRIGLSIVLALSLLTMGATIAKTVITQEASTRARSGDTSYDLPYETCLATVWGAVDQCLLISLGCVPLLYKAVGPILENSFSHISNMFSATISRLSGSNRGRTTKSSQTSSGRSGPFSDRRVGQRSGYVDLELDPRMKRLGSGSGGNTETELLQVKVTSGERQGGTKQNEEPGNIRRTDQVQVTYDDRARATENI